MMKKPSTQKIGRWGEAKAARYYRLLGYRVVRKNWHVVHKEIDLIVEDKTHLVFVEVKTRSTDFQRPAAAVTVEKQRLLISAAKSYLKQNPTNKQTRFDVVEVYATVTPHALLGHRIKLGKINAIQNAFGLR